MSKVDGIKLAYENCKKGNWDNCSKDEIERMMTHYYTFLLMNEETMTIKQYDNYINFYNKLIDLCEERNLI